MIPVVGWLSDKIGVVRVSGLAFLAMGIFFLAMTQVSEAWHLKVLYAFYGVGMAGVNVGWSLGPAPLRADGPRPPLLGRPRRLRRDPQRPRAGPRVSWS